ncbi:hypothetical protein SZ64_02725 [Erythrobacter sp. SG61-1L]|uniref:hypothetical protein n=1 Tax=Erythrobacter sp. SG61-1L TaxID=1603897 RepID=UPI0006C8F310|nr:hypothetical protein [Erythrobacter sp. SG61-1L]KPL67104.1 hypothetical protein SZ64_02725 [Erythrobacter sp. SG61-1L]
MRRAGPVLAALLIAGAAIPAAAEPASPQQREAAFARLPYWDGLWLTEDDETTIGGLSAAAQEAKESGEASPTLDIMKLIGFDAPWNEEGKRRQSERMKTQGNRKADGWGYPMMMNGAAPIQFLITPEEVLIINAYRDVRHVYTDGRNHPGEDDIWATVWGDAIGHWQGDTLVIDTVAVKNPNSFFHTAPPLSEEAHYVERIRMVSPDRIEAEMTIEDPVTLAAPWKVNLAWVRAEGFDRMIHDNYDNDRTGFDGEFNTIEPTSDGQ